MRWKVAARCATEAFSTTCAVHIEDCEAGGCLAVMTQWQSTGGSSQKCLGFNSQRLTAFSLSLIFASYSFISKTLFLYNCSDLCHSDFIGRIIFVVTQKRSLLLEILLGELGRYVGTELLLKFVVSCLLRISAKCSCPYTKIAYITAYQLPFLCSYRNSTTKSFLKYQWHCFCFGSTVIIW